MRAPTPALPVTDEQRSVLEKLIRPRTAPPRDLQRARVLLMAADGFANTRIATEVQVSTATVASWRERFLEDGMKNFADFLEGDKIVDGGGVRGEIDGDFGDVDGPRESCVSGALILFFVPDDTCTGADASSSSSCVDFCTIERPELVSRFRRFKSARRSEACW